MFGSIAKTLTKWVLTLSSFSGVIYFFIIVNQFDIPGVSVPGLIDGEIIKYICKNVLITAGFVFLSWLSLRLAILVFKSGETLEVKDLKPIESTAMPVYIGLFVIALEIGDNKLSESLVILTVLLVLWGLFERIFYFNPIWLFFGYRFYEVHTVTGNTFTLITKRADLKGAIDFNSLRRVNNYTYLEESYQ